MESLITAIQVILGIAFMALIRASRGPNHVDRIVALDLVLLLVAGGLAVHGARAGSELFVAAVIVVALVAFVGTVVVARFIEWRDAP